MCIEIDLRWGPASLRGHGSEVPSDTECFEVLALEPEWAARATQSDSEWRSANVELFAIEMANLQRYDEPSCELAARVEREFLRAAVWLDSRLPGAFDRWLGQGLTADIFIGGWLLNEQLDIVLPASFLMACGRAGLPIHICTNG